MKNKEIAKAVILSYIGSSLSAESMRIIYDIRAGDNELLLDHVKALHHIFENAIKEIENEKN